MTEKGKLWLVGGIGLATIVGLWYVSSQQSGGGGATAGPNDTTVALPSGSGPSSVSYTPDVFNIPALVNSPGPVNPGSQAVFNFADVTYGTPTYPIGGATTLSAPTSADGGVTGGCGCPGNSTTSFGSIPALANAMGPVMNNILYGLANAEHIVGPNAPQWEIDSAFASSVRGEQLQESSNALWGGVKV